MSVNGQEAVIRVEGLAKRYTLGQRTHETQTFREMLAGLAAEPWRRLRGKENRATEDRTFWALRDVTFEVNRGEVMGVIGRNGAGKSTLLKILSQITDPTAGYAEIHGRVASLLEVGTGFHPELTGRENIFLNGPILGMHRSEIRRRFDEIVAFSEVEKFLDTPFKHYSSGMYTRLAFAVAAHLESEILIVDEVLAVGDAQFQKKCLNKMEDVGRSGRTVLFVSHNMAAVSALCQSALLLEQGSIFVRGKVDDVINCYMGRIFSGESPNQFHATHRTGNGLVRVESFEVTSRRHGTRVVCAGGTNFCLWYRATRENLPIQFLIGVYDAFNTRVMFLDSSVVEGLPQRFPAQGCIQVELSEDFSLFPSRYTINVATCVHGEIVDYVQNAMTLEVEEADFFGTGKLPQGKPLVLAKQLWRLTQPSPV